MNEQVLFTETLSALLELAAAKGGVLSQGEIHFYFKDQIKDEAQYDFIYRFLAEKGIRVEGYAAAPAKTEIPKEIDKSTLTEEERQYLAFYEADLAAIEPMTEEERTALCGAMRAGDAQANNRLIEGHLYLLMELLPAFHNRGVRIGDLIQEGNLGLMTGVSTYSGTDFISHVKEHIISAMQAIVAEQTESDDVAKHLLERISQMDTTSRKLAEELGREATKEELAEELHTDVEEVELILKHSIDALTVSVADEVYGKTDE